MPQERADIVAAATTLAADGTLVEVLSRRIPHRTESRAAGCGQSMRGYYTTEITPELERLGFAVSTVENPVSHEHPLLIGRRIEDPSLPTVLLYGHVDVQFAGEGWSEGIDPWQLTVIGDRLYGRGTADNKGQHTVNLLALGTVLKARGQLGWNVTVLFESGEEAGSPGLAAVAETHRHDLAADLFLASDGPRYRAEVPTIFLGSRGNMHLRFECQVSESDHHSGNWGGILANPATILSHAMSLLVGPRGELLLPALQPTQIPAQVREAVAALPENPDFAMAPGSPSATWGHPGLTTAERLLAWNAFEITTIGAGELARPVNSIPGRAAAHANLRWVDGTDIDAVVPAIEAVFAEHHLPVTVKLISSGLATRLDPDSSPARAAVASLTRTTGAVPAVLPNLGGTIPNHVFARTLGLPTIWVPHSYPGCQQHAADEHASMSILTEGLSLMAGLFVDLAEHRDDWLSHDRP